MKLYQTKTSEISGKRNNKNNNKNLSPPQKSYHPNGCQMRQSRKSIAGWNGNVNDDPLAEDGKQPGWRYGQMTVLGISIVQQSSTRCPQLLNRLNVYQYLLSISVINFLTQFYQGTAMLFLQHPHELRSRHEEEQRNTCE